MHTPLRFTLALKSVSFYFKDVYAVTKHGTKQPRENSLPYTQPINTRGCYMKGRTEYFIITAQRALTLTPTEISKDML